MLQELIKSFFLIFMAEMGDKTQILALAFATQFKVQKVLIGVFIGVLLNHAIAVLLGVYLSKLISLNVIQVIASFSFILFSLWTLKIDSDQEEEGNNKKYGPILTVAIAFFIGELGDKTQLTAITLSVDALFPIFVLMGTVLGMVLTSGVGIFIGSKIGKKIPEFTIKIIAAAIFMIFGLQKLVSSIDKEYINVLNGSIFISILFVAVFMILNKSIRQYRSVNATKLQQKAEALYQYYHRMNKEFESICLGEENCKQCQGNDCIIGYAKTLLEHALDNKEGDPSISDRVFSSTISKDYDKDKIIEGLALTIAYIMSHSDQSQGNYTIHKTRNIFEKILFNEIFVLKKDLNHYFGVLNERDEHLTSKLIKKLDSQINLK